MQVTASNRHMFVTKFVQHALFTSVEPLVRAYLRGLVFFIGEKEGSVCNGTTGHGTAATWTNPALSIMNFDELEKVINGEEEVGDLSPLRLAARYANGYTDESVAVNWFWNWVSDLTTLDKRRLLSFISGSDGVPVGGLGQLRLVLMRAPDPHKLPVARTCFMALELPEYVHTPLHHC